MLAQVTQKRAVNNIVSQKLIEKKPEGGRVYAIAFDMAIAQNSRIMKAIARI